MSPAGEGEGPTLIVAGVGGGDGAQKKVGQRRGVLLCCDGLQWRRGYDVDGGGAMKKQHCIHILSVHRIESIEH